MTDTRPDPSRIMQIGMGFFASKTLLSAVELGVFAALGPGALPGEELRNRVGLHPRAAYDFLDALVALGFLERTGVAPQVVYANTPDTAAFLDPESASYFGGILLMANNRLYRHWGNLTEGLRTGLPQNESKDDANADVFASLYADPTRLVEFINAMAGVQRGNFHALAGRFDFSSFSTVCDVGGSGGALSIILATYYKNLRCISYDLSPVTTIARERIEAAGLAGRVEARAGNFMTDDLPAANVITMGNILHDWGTETKQMLIGKAYAALPEGGVFIAIENIIDDARRENAQGLLMSLNMLIETQEGFDYTFSQFDGWCRAAGFSRTEKLPLLGSASAAVAWK